jgi:hypothetical protein
LSVPKERYIGEMFVCHKGKIYRGDVCLFQKKDIQMYRGRCLSVPKERYMGGAMYILIFSPLTETPQSNETETW